MQLLDYYYNYSHSKHNIYIPELIFAHFRTGTNFNDDDNKCTGGKNGYGIKLVNAFSNRFEIETVDRKSKLKYTQVFENNLNCFLITTTSYLITCWTKIFSYLYLPEEDSFSGFFLLPLSLSNFNPYFVLQTRNFLLP